MRLRRPDFERHRFVVTPEQAGARLDEAVSEAVDAARRRRLSKSQARKLIVIGAVRVNGAAVRQPGRRLRAAARVEVSVRPLALARAELPADRPFELTPGAILYEDQALIAIDKPPGLPTQATVDPSRPSLFSSVKSSLGPEAYLGIHQRLDRDTSGVVLFAKDRRANPGLARAFAERAVTKVYAALTAASRASHPQRWHAMSRLSLATGKPPRVRVVVEGGLEAETGFQVLRRSPLVWLVEARPRTGRKHQIRVQLAAAGLPIVGDTLYGGPLRVEGRRVPRAMLHAARLELIHPLTRKPLRIESPLPQDFTELWSVVSAPGAPLRSRR